MTYSEQDDLLLGQLITSVRFDKQTHVQAASDEIDSKVGWRYVTPLVAPGVGGTFDDLPRHEQLFVKNIANKLATGSILLTLDVAGEDTSVHALGRRYLDEARAELAYLADGSIALSAAPLIDVPGGAPPAGGRGPGVINHDDESMVEAFENQVHRREHWWTQPGPIP